MPTPHKTAGSAKHRRLASRSRTRGDEAGGAQLRDPDPAVLDKQIQRWIDDGGADPPARCQIRTLPCVWTPTTLKMRLAAQDAVDALPRRPWGIFTAARLTLARIVAQVEQRVLAQEVAAEQLRELTIRLDLHQRSHHATRHSRSGRPIDFHSLEYK
jgi:hypothetical protein